MATEKFSQDVSVEAICVRVGKKIAGLRRERGWSQRMLADHAGIDFAHLARLELGQKEAGLIILEKIAEALGVPVWKLLQ